jgi:hypothetical protein
VSQNVGPSICGEKGVRLAQKMQVGPRMPLWG